MTHSPDKKKKHIIVIGAGMAGLTSAAILAKRGFKVTLLEKIHQAGGYVHSFTKKNYRFEASTHQICGINDDYLLPLLKELDIDKNFFVKSENQFEYIKFNKNTYETEKRIRLKAGFKNIIQQLIEHFPADKKCIVDYFKMLDDLYKDIIRMKAVVRNPKRNIMPTVFALLLKNGKGTMQKIGIWYYKTLISLSKTTQQQINDTIENKDLCLILNTYGLYTGCPPSRLNAFAMSAINTLYYKGGAFLIKGGSSQYINKLLDIIAASGGKVLYNTSVDKIVSEYDKVKGVSTAEGDYFPCDGVISGMNARDLILDHCDHSLFPRKYLHELEKVTYSSSVFQIYLGLKIDIKDYGFKASANFFSSENDQELNHSTSMTVSPRDRGKTMFLLSNYSAHYPDAAPEGHSAICIAELMPMHDWNEIGSLEYKERKRRTEDAIIEKVEKITGIPLRKNIEVVFSGTPRTMYHYSSTPEGAMLGAELTSDQVLKKRTQMQTPPENLFLAGATVSVGGVAACIESGIITANALEEYLKEI